MSPSSARAGLALSSLLLALLCPSVLWARPTPVGRTGYTIEVPRGLRVVRTTQPRILFQASDGEDEATIQAVLRPGDGGEDTLFRGPYFQAMRAIIPGLSLKQQGRVELGWERALWVRLSAFHLGSMVDVHAIYLPLEPDPVVVHTIATAPYRQAMLQALHSLRRPAPPRPTPQARPPREPTRPPVASTPAPVALGPARPVPTSRATLRPPEGWTVLPGANGSVLAMSSPDGLGMAQVSRSEIPPGKTVQLVRDQLEEGLAASVPSNSGLPYSLHEAFEMERPPGARWMRFRSSHAGAIGDQVFVLVPLSREVLIFNVVIQSSRREALEPALRACLASIREPGVESARVPTRETEREPPSRPPPAWGGRGGNPPPKRSTPKPKPKPKPRPSRKWQRIEDGVAGLTFEVPEDWKRRLLSPTRSLFLPPAGSREAGTSLRIWHHDRRDPAHADLARSRATLMEELSGGGGKVLGAKKARYGGVPCEVVHSKMEAAGGLHVFRYLLLERPGVVVRVAFVAPTATYRFLKPLLARFEKTLTPVVPTQSLPPREVRVPTPPDPEEREGTEAPPPVETPPPAIPTSPPDLEEVVPDRTPTIRAKSGDEDTDQGPSIEVLRAREEGLRRRLESDLLDTALVRELAESRAELAFRLHREGRIEEAVDFLHASLAEVPGNPEYHEALGDMLVQLGGSPARALAQSHYEEALVGDPSRRDCRSKLAASYLASGDFSDARHHFEILTENSGGEPDTRFVRDLLLSYLAADEASQGVVFLRHLFFASGDPALGIALGIMLDAAGETAAAINQLQGMHFSRRSTEEQKAYAKALVARYAARKGGDR